MLKWKRLLIMTTSVSILLTQGAPLPYLAYAMEEANRAPINGEVNFSWTTSNQVTLGSTFNPYEGLEAIDADGDNVAVLTKIEGDVNTKSIGFYPVTYSIQNVDGETFTVTRQIEVVALNSQDETTEEVSSESQNNQEQVSGEDVKQESEASPLKDVMWTLYDRSTEQELIKLNVNVETGLYEGQLIEDLKSLLENVDEETLNQEVLKLRILTSQQAEKIAITLTVRDLLGETDVLKVLNELPYEMDDQVSITPLLKEKTILVVHGVIGGDISKEKEDYSDGVESEDLINNVRFILQETGLSTVYNEAPVIEGIEDTVVTNFETFDPKSGVVVKDDHDENLLSHLVINTEQIDENTHRITYKVTDSWGRVTKGERKIYKKNPVNSSEAEIADNNLIHQDNQVVEGLLKPNELNIAPSEFSLVEPALQNIEDIRQSQISYTHQIIVDGVTYANGASKRLAIGIDQSGILRLDYQDGLVFNPSVKGTYFDLTIYDSNMNRKLMVRVLGTDRSDSSKLSVIDGFQIADGDYISILLDESETKLKMIGIIGNKPTDQQPSQSETDFTVDNPVSGFPAEYLENHRFQYNSKKWKSLRIKHLNSFIHFLKSRWNVGKMILTF